MDSTLRTEALEIKVAYLEDTVEQLNAVVITLRRELDTLQEALRQLKTEHREPEAAIRDIEPPPHY